MPNNDREGVAKDKESADKLALQHVDNLMQSSDAHSDHKDSPSDDVDDDVTDKAIDDIASQDSDELLARQDEAAKAAETKFAKPNKSLKARLIGLAKNKWTWVGVAVLLVAIFALPFTRYKLLGLVIKKDVPVVVTDSTTNTPVSNAIVYIAGKQAKTDASGKANLHVSVGGTKISVSKQFYSAYSSKLFVGLGSVPSQSVKLVATGRQVTIKVLNSVTARPLAAVDISVDGTSAKTDTQGLATVVLPTKSSTLSANLTTSGFNNKTVTVSVITGQSLLNTFSLTPTGQVYFLSNASGKIDVVKSNLDGSDRQTVLAGTGNEDPNNTSLLASRDWSFLVLEAQRSGSQPSLYLIDTSDDKATQFDSGNYTFTPVGWYGHNFIYTATSGSLSPWQNGYEVLKSYNADSGALNQLDQSQGSGSSGSYTEQSFTNFIILNNSVTYTVTWNDYYSDVSADNDSIRAVQPGGQNKKDYQTWPASSTSYISSVLAKPQLIYYSVSSSSNGNQTTTYYDFDGQTVTPDTSLTSTTFAQTYPTYLLSPSGNQSAWTEQRDGQNTVFVGDKNGQNGQQLAYLSGYKVYGWYSDSYLLVSLNDSELFVVPVAGLTSNQTPLKMGDYYKPPYTYQGYGYGYGGQ